MIAGSVETVLVTGIVQIALSTVALSVLNRKVRGCIDRASCHRAVVTASAILVALAVDTAVNLRMRPPFSTIMGSGAVGIATVIVNLVGSIMLFITGIVSLITYTTTLPNIYFKAKRTKKEY